MKKTLSLALVMITVLSLRAQDPEFTQFYANPLYLNPALAGSAQGPRMALNYRNQWSALPASFITYALSYDQHFDALAGGIGVQVLYDVAGEGSLSTSMGSLMYSYHLNVTPKFSVKAALQTSIQQKRIDFSQLIFGDQLHPRMGIIRESDETFAGEGVYLMDPFLDFSAGIVGFTNLFYAGYAAHHLNRPRQTFLNDPDSRLPVKHTTHVGMQIPLEDSRFPTRFISPNLLVQMQSNFMQINLGTYYSRDNFVIGAWWRQTSYNTDAFMLLIGLKRDPFKIGYSYDITFSDIRTGGHGSHEISINLEFATPNRISTDNKWRKLQCPSF